MLQLMDRVFINACFLHFRMFELFSKLNTPLNFQPIIPSLFAIVDSYLEYFLDCFDSSSNDANSVEFCVLSKTEIRVFPLLNYV